MSGSTVGRVPPRFDPCPGHHYPRELVDELRTLLGLMVSNLSADAVTERAGRHLWLEIEVRPAESAPDLMLSLRVHDLPSPAEHSFDQQVSSLAGLPVTVSERPGLVRLLSLSDDGRASTHVASTNNLRIDVPASASLAGTTVAEIPWANLLPIGVGLAGSGRITSRQQVLINDESLALTIFEDDAGGLRVAAHSADESKAGAFIILALTAPGRPEIREFALPLAGIDPVGRMAGSLRLGAAPADSQIFICPKPMMESADIGADILSRSAESAADKSTRDFLIDLYDRKLRR